MTPEGYRAVLLDRVREGWEQELRMPLIQRIVATTYGRPEDEFAVGYQELDASNLQTISYSVSQIDAAEETARQLAVRVMTEINPTSS
jgi:hypothetical protein